MSQLEQFIKQRGFTLKPKTDTTHAWAAVLRSACREIYLEPGKDATEEVINFLTALLQKGEVIAQRPTGRRRVIALSDGTVEFYWLNQIRLRLKETDKDLPLVNPQVINSWLLQKIDLLEQLQNGSVHCRNTVAEFLNAWLIELESHHDTLVR